MTITDISLEFHSRGKLRMQPIIWMEILLHTLMDLKDVFQNLLEYIGTPVINLVN